MLGATSLWPNRGAWECAVQGGLRPWEWLREEVRESRGRRGDPDAQGQPGSRRTLSVREQHGYVSRAWQAWRLRAVV